MANCISCGSPDFYDSGFSAECVNSSCRLFSQKHKDAVYGAQNVVPTASNNHGYVYHLPTDAESIFIQVHRGGAWVKSTTVDGGSMSYSQTYVRRGELYHQPVAESLDVEVSPDGETEFFLGWTAPSIKRYEMQVIATDVFYLVSSACTSFVKSP